MDGGDKQYMVEFDVYYQIDGDFEAKIPSQRKAISKLFEQGKLLAYSLSKERTKLWGVFLVSSESELVQVIDALPLTPYMDYDYSELLFHNGLSLIPTMSMN
ncbi:muconolactone Delta-isomerase family protein [Portibacter marinus]|uniref:muconolactone Delta-isomerase family protein n=1 Tax=Portibacter marinus TaxID=2898660 RepID=UPI001F305342|nr:muconolactone Delta-isomerase family protein [Portibacter marinus]